MSADLLRQSQLGGTLHVDGLQRLRSRLLGDLHGFQSQSIVEVKNVRVQRPHGLLIGTELRMHLPHDLEDVALEVSLLREHLLDVAVGLSGYRTGSVGARCSVSRILLDAAF